MLSFMYSTFRERWISVAGNIQLARTLRHFPQSNIFVHTLSGGAGRLWAESRNEELVISTYCMVRPSIGDFMKMPLYSGRACSAARGRGGGGAAWCDSVPKTATEQ